MAETQQSWEFEVGDGGSPTEVFTQLPGLKEVPSFTPHNRSLRDATTIDHVATSTTKRQRFNRLLSGQELTLSMYFLPGDTVQDYLFEQEGDNGGINCRFNLIGDDQTESWRFTALVLNKTIEPAGADDESGVDMVTVTLVVNSAVTKVRTATP